MGLTRRLHEDSVERKVCRIRNGERGSGVERCSRKEYGKKKKLLSHKRQYNGGKEGKERAETAKKKKA